MGWQNNFLHSMHNPNWNQWVYRPPPPAPHGELRKCRPVRSALWLAHSAWPIWLACWVAYLAWPHRSAELYQADSDPMGHLGPAHSWDQNSSQSSRYRLHVYIYIYMSAPAPEILPSNGTPLFFYPPTPTRVSSLWTPWQGPCGGLADPKGQFWGPTCAKRDSKNLHKEVTIWRPGRPTRAILGSKLKRIPKDPQKKNYGWGLSPKGLCSVFFCSSLGHFWGNIWRPDRPTGTI